MRTARVLLAALLLPAAAAELRAQDQRQLSAVLWAPASGYLDWAAVEKVLERYPEAKLTLALDPGMIPEAARAGLSERVKDGRVEAALRIAGDPVLPLIQSRAPRDVAERVAVAKARLRGLLGATPAGLVPGCGELSAETAAALAAQKLRWAAAGAAVSPWLSSDLAVVPFEPALPGRKPQDGPVRLIFDEAEGLVPAGAGLEMIGALLSEERRDWATVSEAATAGVAAAPPEPWPAWAGDPPSAEDDALRGRAMDLYVQASQALSGYQDSGQAQIEQLNKALEALQAAQSGAFLRRGALKDPSVDKAFRTQLRAVFKTIRKPVPPALFAPLVRDAAGSGEAPDQDDVPPGRVAVGRAGDSLLFENPADSIVKVPAPPPALAPGTTAQDLWSILKLDVAWHKDSVSFTVEMKKLEGAERSPLRLELYIDLNHLAGRGNTHLLPGRKAFVTALDAWEYLIAISGSSGGLYRAGSGREPILVDKLQPAIDAKEGEITVSIPRSRLRGDPSGWGYLLLATVPEPGSPVLGLLGNAEDQRSFFSDKAGYTRLPMMRLEKH